MCLPALFIKDNGGQFLAPSGLAKGTAHLDSLEFRDARIDHYGVGTPRTDKMECIH
jgi:hypothetical protein